MVDNRPLPIIILLYQHSNPKFNKYYILVSKRVVIIIDDK